MKRIIYGMSFHRDYALKRCKEYASVLCEHVLKCLIYYRMRPEDINGWIKEISTWLVAISRITVKETKTSKLKARQYRQTVFFEFGETKDDAISSLESFKLRFTGKVNDPYPDFEITDELVNDVYEVFKELIETFIPLFTAKGTLEVQYVQNKLHEILGM